MAGRHLTMRPLSGAWAAHIVALKSQLLRRSATLFVSWLSKLPYTNKSRLLLAGCMVYELLGTAMAYGVFCFKAVIPR